MHPHSRNVPLGPEVRRIPCARPPGLRFAIVPKSWPERGPISLLCGHRILPEHRLVIDDPHVPNKVELMDPACVLDDRDSEGRRRLSFLGRFLHVSVHRCHSCRQRRQLENAIVCPLCAGMIVCSSRVRLVESGLVRQSMYNLKLVPYLVTAVGGELTVVCETCANTPPYNTAERGYMWSENDTVVGPYHTFE